MIYNKSNYRSLVNSREEAFLEWLETPWNADTKKYRKKMKKREDELKNKQRLKPMSLLEQKIGLGFLVCLIIGMVIIGL